MDWFYAHHNEQRGPVTEQEFRELVTRGVVTAETLVWNETLPEWRPFANVSDPAAANTSPSYSANLQSPTGQVQCAHCKNIFPEEDTIAYKEVHVCARCKPFFFQSLREGVNVPGELRYAGFWIRVVAMILDNIIFAMFVYLIYGLGALVFYQMGDSEAKFTIMLIAQIVWTLFTICGQIVYSGYFLGKHGATPGKMIFGIKVVRPDGSAITTARGYGRALGNMVSSMTCLIGYIIVAFDDQKRALHDYMCDTRVVYK